MLQRSVLFMSMVSSRSLSHATAELNKLLNVGSRAAPVPHDDLKQFLSKHVTPVLGGTSLDRSNDAAAMRRMLGQLVRDAAFSATLLRARPDGRFVRAIVDCIANDGARLRFLQRMTSAQASKTIEHLCRAGVRDPVAYSPLVAKLDYHNLKEVARVMFAFAEVDLNEMNTGVVVPLYCGEKWCLAYDTPPSGAPKPKPENASCNVFEAVRVLRALSKSTRAVVEQQRHARQHHSGGGSATHGRIIAVGSIGQLRNEVLAFIFEQQNVMRGAHWSNVARALVHFPEELQTIEGDAVAPGSALAREMTTVIGARHPAAPGNASSTSATTTTTTCDDVALLCLQRVFDMAEGRRESVPREPPHAAPPATDVAAFDLTQLDLVKLVPLLHQVPCAAEVSARRFQCVFGAISANLSDMLFGGLVQLMHTLRHIEASAAFTDEALQKVAREAGSRLAADPPEQVIRQIPAARIAQFAALLSAFRVRECPGYVAFMERGAALLPGPMSPDTAATYLNGLTAVVGKGGAGLNQGVRQAVLAIVGNTIDYGSGYRSGEIEDSLLFRYPTPCAKILRAMVLLDVVPTAAMVYAVFGRRGEAHLNSHLASAGAVVLFDLSRSLAHLCRQARALQSETDRVEAPPTPSGGSAVPEDTSIEEVLWQRGFRGTLLPLLLEHTMALAQSAAGSGGRLASPSASSYVPLCWRSTMECAAVYLDVTLDVSKDFDRMASRVLALHESSKVLSVPMLAVLAAQCASARHAARSPQAVQRDFSHVPFSSNAVIHGFSFVLVWEYLAYQAVWEAARVLSTAARKATLSEKTLDLAAQVTKLKSDYQEYLSAPSGGGGGGGGGGVSRPLTPMETLNLAFSDPGAPTAANVAILLKPDILEITTHLPFAISLVMDPGPVNDFFSEKCVPLILETDEAGSNMARYE